MWIFKLLSITRNATPEMKATIRQALDALDAEARKTKGEADDLAVTALRTVCTLLGLTP